MFGRLKERIIHELRGVTDGDYARAMAEYLKENELRIKTLDELVERTKLFVEVKEERNAAVAALNDCLEEINDLQAELAVGSLRLCNFMGIFLAAQARLEEKHRIDRNFIENGEFKNIKFVKEN